MHIVFYILTGLGWISVLLHLIAFATKHRKKMLIYNLVSTGLIGLSMIPYGGFNGTAICFFSIASKLTGLTNYGKNIRNKYKATIGILFGITFFLIFENEGIEGILPSLSLVFIVCADLQQDILKMKLWYYGSATCWILYAISIASPVAIAYDFIGIFVLTYSVYKIIKSRKSSETNIR